MIDDLRPLMERLAEPPTASTKHMSPDERFMGARQMWSDLHRLATADGCIAAAWALERLALPPAAMTALERLQIEVDAAAHLEAGIRGTGKPTDVYPDWVYEARDAIRRQNANPPPWLPDLLAALGWQGGTIHNALNVVRRLVAVSKGEHAAATFREASRSRDESKPDGSREELERCARMLDTYAPELYPANELGQIDFARAMMESTADVIRAFLVRVYGTAESPTPDPMDDAEPPPPAQVEALAVQIVRDMEALGELAGQLPEADYLALAPRIVPLIEEADARVRQKFPHLFGGAP